MLSIMAVFCVFILFVALLIAGLIYKQRQYEAEMLEMFTLRNQLSNARFQSSVSQSITSMKGKKHG